MSDNLIVKVYIETHQTSAHALWSAQIFILAGVLVLSVCLMGLMCVRWFRCGVWLVSLRIWNLNLLLQRDLIKSAAPARRCVLLLCDVREIRHHHTDGRVRRRRERRRVVWVRDGAGAVEGSPRSPWPPPLTPPVDWRTVLRPAVWWRFSWTVRDQSSASHRQLFSIAWIRREVSHHHGVSVLILHRVWSGAFIFHELLTGFLPSVCQRAEKHNCLLFTLDLVLRRSCHKWKEIL